VITFVERAEGLAGKRDGGHQPALGRAACHVEVEDPIQAKHHAEAVAETVPV